MSREYVIAYCRAGRKPDAWPLMLDVRGSALTEDDRKRVLSTRCRGVILFARNYEKPGGTGAVDCDIRALKSPPR